MSAYPATEALIDAGDDLVGQSINPNSSRQQSYNSISGSNQDYDPSDNPSGDRYHDRYHDPPDNLYDLQGNKFPKNLHPRFLSVPESQRPNYKLLFGGIALFITGSAAAIPSILDAVTYLICQQQFPEIANPPVSPVNPLREHPGFVNPNCFVPAVQAQVGLFQSYQTTINALFSSLTIPLISSLSDRIGRKTPLLLSSSCTVLSLLITLLCTAFPATVPYKLMLLGSAIEGLGGSVLVMGILLSSYVSDSVRESCRAPMLSISDSIVYGGLALGPLVGSTFLKLTNHSITRLFACSVALEVTFWVTMLIWLPESRLETGPLDSVLPGPSPGSPGSAGSSDSCLLSKPSQRTRPVLSALRRIGTSLLLPLNAFKLPHIPRHHSRIRLNAYILMFVFSSIIEVGTSVIPLIFIYAKLQFKWTSVENGYFISTLAGSRFVVLAIALPSILSWVRRHFHHSARYVDRTDLFFLRFGLVVSFVAYVALSRAPNGTVFLCEAVLFALSSCETPILKNTLMKFAERGKVAELLGLSQFLARAGSIFAPTLFALVFHKTAGYRPQLVLEMVAGIVLCLLVAINFLYVGPPPPAGDVLGEGESQAEN